MAANNTKCSKFLLFSAVVLLTTVHCTKKSVPSTESAQTDPILAMQAELEKAPSYENHIRMGLKLAEVDRGKEALEFYKKATTINPGAPLAWNNICAEYNKMGQFGDAIPNCEKAVALDEKFELAKNNLKLAKESLVALAKTAVEKQAALLKNKEATAQDYINTGLELFNARVLDASVEVWNRVKKGDELYAMAQNNLASAFILLNKFDAAEKAIGEALRLEPNNPLYQNNKKWLEDARAEKK